PPREYRLAESERDPADHRATGTRGGVGAGGGVGAVGDECNESRGVCRGGDDGARHPGPSAVERDPPTVVEWSPAPRLVVDPRPAVGRIKGPPSHTVRSPIRCDVLGYPRMSVFGGVLPRAELVEIL